MSIFKRTDVTARLEATKKSGLKNVFTNEEGAIDLASIMVGVIVIGIVGSVISATVFAVIPWAQDQAASQSLDAVKTAESVAFADSATDNIAGSNYLTKAQLVKGTGAAGAIGKDGLLQNSGSIAIEAVGAHYIAASASGSGAYYYLDSNNPTNIKKVASIGALNSAAGPVTPFDEASFVVVAP